MKKLWLITEIFLRLGSVFFLIAFAITHKVEYGIWTIIVILVLYFDKPTRWSKEK